MKNITLNVQGMSCGHCINSIEGSVGQLEGINQVNVKLNDAQVEVTFNESQVSLDKIKETIEDQGYEVK
ncbi:MULTISPECIES: copper chaperone CopZ [Peribacillus]|uniref:Copper chaperone CopZ n=1 Tax=Peribacillus castrilensis TaxID=2897690 RepID=A0AAW9NLX1_9BACI|nr:copper chaperone CopZ [Peribacillus frigoritolerans]MEC0275799.1 copper chaperone CopZ [Peribacillus castrilensis]MEC0301105.1 copper chaperone CopZ [Peribacillus castrilensis]MEC0344906.1 copper chaperone CopZ [Peribacillus castrilensis]TFH62291.1 copper chaperone CopZ [Peribacillus frigoritolerans]